MPRLTYPKLQLESENLERRSDSEATTSGAMAHPHLGGRGNLLAALASMMLLAAGSLSAISGAYPFWIAVAIWALIVSILPILFSPGSRRLLTWWLVLPIALVFIVQLILLPFSVDLWQMNSPANWLVGGISLFSLCLTTLLALDTYSAIRMPPPFLVLMSLVFYEALLAMQGPIGYYGDRLLGTDHILDNKELMIYIVASSIVGLALTLVTHSFLRHIPSEELKQRAVGGGGTR
jgi:hypothetical protein